MRPPAATEPGKFGGEMMPVAEQIEGDAAKLGAEAIAAGYIPKPSERPTADSSPYAAAPDPQSIARTRRIEGKAQR
jgi:hypothetical protein